jgi:hypothetical protein
VQLLGGKTGDRPVNQRSNNDSQSTGTDVSKDNFEDDIPF